MNKSEQINANYYRPLLKLLLVIVVSVFGGTGIIGNSTKVLAQADKPWHRKNPVDARIEEQKNEESFEELIRSLDREAYNSLPQQVDFLEEHYLESAQELIESQATPEGSARVQELLDEAANDPQTMGEINQWFSSVDQEASPAEKEEMLHRLDPLAKSYRESGKSSEPQAKPNRPWILQELTDEATKNPENRRAVKEWLRSLKE